MGTPVLYVVHKVHTYNYIYAGTFMYLTAPFFVQYYIHIYCITAGHLLLISHTNWWLSKYLNIPSPILLENIVNITQLHVHGNQNRLSIHSLFNIILFRTWKTSWFLHIRSLEPMRTGQWDCSIDGKTRTIISTYSSYKGNKSNSRR